MVRCPLITVRLLRVGEIGVSASRFLDVALSWRDGFEFTHRKLERTIVLCTKLWIVYFFVLLVFRG